MATTTLSSPAGHLDEESGLLPDRPPHWILWAVSWLFISLFLCALAIALFVPFPDVIRCPYVMVIQGGSDPIQSPCNGVVRTVLVSEGQRVAAGDELFVLSSDEVRGWDTESRSLQEDLKTRQSDLVRDDAADTEEMAVKERESAQTQDEISYRENYVATIRKQADQLEKLSKTGAISQEELITHELELTTAEKDLSLAKKSLEQVTLQRQEMQTQHERRDADAQDEMNKMKLRLQALQDQMQNTRSNLRSVRAPYDAVVVSLAERNQGSVVQNGQELCQLARPGAPLRARLLLSELGLPRLAVGDKVRFFAEAFPYQRYGTLTGRLDWLSPAAIASTQGDQFVAYATLDRDSFVVNGRHHPLQAGMKGDAHIIVGSRTLAEYAFEPLRQLREDTRL
jgi:multidrug efflux pump subunit AcrA (membrane-fusion protein)